MGFWLRKFSRSDEQLSQPSMRTMVVEERRASADDHDQLVEIEIHGEGARQAALARIAGPKTLDGKQQHVGVVLRCEPTNPYDANAVRVEAMGQHVGFVSRQLAVSVSPAMQRRCGGVLEARGVIVGGWDNGDSDEGHYRIRVWITTRDADRLSLRPDDIDLSLPKPWPKAPTPLPNERRLTPDNHEHEDAASAVTVTCEEHYQPTIEASIPSGWNPARTWPARLCDLLVADRNPHSARTTPCIEVRIGDATVGFLTPKMSERHLFAVQECATQGKRATTTATVSHGVKGGTDIVRVKVFLPK